MSFLGVCFVVILIVALIGVDNIIPVLVIGGTLLLIGWFLFKKWTDRIEEENDIRDSEITKSCLNTSSHFSQGYNVRPQVTGDHFKFSYGSYNLSTSTYKYCQFANTSVCVNCSRRKEHINQNLYYYGVSNNCKEYNYAEDD